jgi:nicotinate-nucleotide adenylyltransferase
LKFNSGNSIGLLGGTFDPIHLGHLHIIETLAGKFDQIALIPTGQPWMKPETPIAKPKQRLEMCEAALEDLTEAAQEKAFVIDIEVEKSGLSYTFDTLQSLRAFFPRDNFTLILGTDAAFSFNKWKRPEDIKKMAEILVVKRPGAKPSDFKELEVNAPDISSTDVREELAATGKTTKVSKNVMAYIKQNGLYGSK